jgi:hypothetical protein
MQPLLIPLHLKATRLLVRGHDIEYELSVAPCIGKHNMMHIFQVDEASVALSSLARQ